MASFEPTGPLPKPSDNGAAPWNPQANRRAWNAWAEGYDTKHGRLLRGELAEAWGLWRLPEAGDGFLGDIQDRVVLELGCGAGDWSASLARRGARWVYSLDIAREQLKIAACRTAGASVSLIEADAAHLPLATGVIDLVISDYGAMSWVDPYRSVPEVARVLRPAGRLVFCTHTPWFFVCLDPQTGKPDHGLHSAYFEVKQRSVRGTATDYQLPYGQWINLFQNQGLRVERLHEVRPGQHAATTFTDRPLTWARDWPAEAIWVVERIASNPPD